MSDTAFPNWWLELAAATLKTSTSWSDIITIIYTLPLNEQFVQTHLARRQQSGHGAQPHTRVTETCNLIFNARPWQPVDRSVKGHFKDEAVAKAFEQVQFRDWVSVALGNRVEVVDDLLSALRFFKESRNWENGASHSDHPLASWIRNSRFKHPFSILETFFEDIRETLASPKSLQTVIDKLKVLHFRWEILKSEPTIARLRQLPSGFEILTFCHRDPTPLQVVRQAELLTTRDLAEFFKFCIWDLGPRRTSSLNLHRACSRKQQLQDEVVGCMYINPHWSSTLIFLLQALEQRDNLNSASAILEGLAIKSSGVPLVAFDLPLSTPLGSHHAAILSHRPAALPNPTPFLLTNTTMRASDGPALFFRRLSTFVVKYGQKYRPLPPHSAAAANEELVAHHATGHYNVASIPNFLGETSTTVESFSAATAPKEDTRSGTIWGRLQKKESVKKFSALFGLSRSAPQ